MIYVILKNMLKNSVDQEIMYFLNINKLIPSLHINAHTQIQGSCRCNKVRMQ